MRLTPIERFLKYTKKTDSCWLWKRSLSAGYGHFHLNGKDIPAHRASYEFFKSPIPDGLHIDHLCRVRHCVNPNHLEPVTREENFRRGAGTRGILYSPKTHCKRGHLLTPQNCNKQRACLTCLRAWKDTYLRNLREQTTNKPKKVTTHCIHEHEYSPSNTEIRKSDGAKLCLKCRVIRQHEIREIVGPTRPRDQCINGHKYTAQNTYLRPDGYKVCRKCKSDDQKKRWRGYIKDRTSCKNGHKYTLENIYLNQRGIKECRTCRTERSRIRMAAYHSGKSPTE